MDQNFQNEEGLEINVIELFFALLNNIVIIILTALTFAFAAYYVTGTLVDKKFQSTTKLYVVQQKDQNSSISYSDLQTGTQLTKDYAQLIKSRAVANKVIADLDLPNSYPDMKNITPQKLLSMITVSTATDTRVLSITITDTNPTRAQDIANSVRRAAATQIKTVMNIDEVNVMDEANLPEAPSSPNRLKDTLLAGIVGFVIAAAITVIIELLDDTIKTPDDVERYLGISVLGSIPYDEEADTTIGKGKGKKKKKSSKPGSKK